MKPERQKQQGGTNIKNRIKSLSAYTFSHFCVDFACFYILLHGFRNSTDNLQLVSTAFLIYNVVAFGLQPIIGYYCDKRPKIPVGLAGCIIVLLGLALLSLHWTSLLLCAFGNACFHVGGGIDCLAFAKGKMSGSGIYVSTGSLGVVFGTLAGNYKGDIIYIPIILMLVSIISVFLFAEKDIPEQNTFDVSSSLPFSVILISASVAIIIRAYVGGIIPVSWKTDGYLSLLPGFGAFIGKAAGGFLGDKFGAKTVGVSTLILSIPFLILGNNNVVLSVIGIILFNMTMPITLCVIASKFPRNPGFAFGLPTLALLCGVMPSFYFVLPQRYVYYTMVIFILVSAACLLISSKNNKGDKRNDKIGQRENVQKEYSKTV